ncbi:hypothetical protein LXA43DRAFT_31255 [Ganoderma leucocontextum]|nr:hypothetical protein LXA43DRAFT_31255 [Ganoderma leucocontextum]
MSDSLNPSGTGNHPPGAGTQPEALDQSQSSGAYDELQRSQGGDMGGGRAAAGSGVAGGYESHEQQSQPASAGEGQRQQQTGEKQDWLDKGFESVGKKVGINVSDKNADTAGDFINKEFTSKAGRGIPGVQ